ncbi:MAG: RNA polymerase sigma factor [Gemmataceae bacterium]
MQETLLRVFLSIDSFDHKGRGSFRAWLKTIARNVWLKLLQKRIAAEGGSALAQDLQGQISLYSPDARDDLVQMFDEIARREILNLAMERVEPLVTPTTWMVYCLADLDHVPRQEIADRLQLSLNAVHHSVLRVRAMLRREIQKIDPDSSPGSPGEDDAHP